MAPLNSSPGSPIIDESLRERLFSHPRIETRDVEAVAEAVRTKDLSMPNGVTIELEAELRTFFGTEHALCTQNGTSALYSALYAVGDGDDPESALEGMEVLCPTYNAWFDVAPILAFGGTPVFCDIQPGSMTIDLEDLREKITPKTGVLVLPYMHSETSDLDTLRVVVNEHDLSVVEDASRAWGCRWDGELLGTVFDVGVLSMGASKTLVSAEGGVLVTDEQAYFDRAVALGHYERLMGIEGIPGADDEHPFATYRNTGMGYKFRISPLSAALAKSKLRTLDDQIAREREAMATFREAMSDVESVELVDTDSPQFERGGHFVVPVKFKPDALSVERETVVSELESEGFSVSGVSGHFLHLEPRFERSEYWGAGQHPVSDDLQRRVVVQQAPRDGTHEDIQAYVDGFQSVISRLT